MKGFYIFIKTVILIGLVYIKYNGIIDGYFEESHFHKIFNYIIFLITLNSAYSIFVFVYKKRKKLKRRQADNILFGARNIYYLILALSFLGLILSLAGIKAGTLFTTLSIVAAAIAVVTKEYISPVIAGFHIALSKTLSINDYVKIGEQKGKIVDLNLTKLKLLSDDDDLIAISNEKAYFSEITNYTKGNTRKVGINFELPLNFPGTIDSLESNLVDEILEFSNFIEPDSYFLRVEDIKKDSFNLKFFYILKKNDDRVLEKQIRKKTIRKVINYIKNNRV